jgi:hypothetical protein
MQRSKQGFLGLVCKRGRTGHGRRGGHGLTMSGKRDQTPSFWKNPENLTNPSNTWVLNPPPHTTILANRTDTATPSPLKNKKQPLLSFIIHGKHVQLTYQRTRVRNRSEQLGRPKCPEQLAPSARCLTAGTRRQFRRMSGQNTRRTF